MQPCVLYVCLQVPEYEGGGGGGGGMGVCSGGYFATEGTVYTAHVLTAVCVVFLNFKYFFSRALCQQKLRF